MDCCLGVDTSNYTTSCAVIETDSNIYHHTKKLLSVDGGQRGLRQSDALFLHTKQIPEVFSQTFSKIDNANIKAIGVSDKPRSVKNSYMPCFLAGVASAEAISSCLGVPIFRFSHQAGHIAAALLSSNRLDLIDKKFIAFHISGGTTEALLVEPSYENFFDCKIIAKTLDLNMGQIVDRVGIKMGLSFPCGKEVDRLANLGQSKKNIKIVLKDNNCCLSGLENQCDLMIKQGQSNEDVCRYLIDYLNKVLEEMTKSILEKYDLPLIFAGGVMSNSIISRNLTSAFSANFAAPDLSSDNAVGIALMTSILYNRGK